jgi:hypothetical protein
VVEFKYFKAKEAKRVKALAAARGEDVQQVKGYARDIHAQFPHFKMRTYVVYIAANKVCKVWEV